jgi:arsenical pump membrane protein
VNDWAVAVIALGATLAIALGWRHRAAPPIGAAIGAVVLATAGLVTAADVHATAIVLWRPLVTVSAIMVMTACAHEVGLIAHLATLIEPRTRGPVRRAFRSVFVLSALTAMVLSNDAAILLLTPAVISLLRTVYPKRHGKFVVPFAFAVFYAAGVAPFVTSNPMNLVVADRAGIGFNEYALRMVPVALVGWIVAYAVMSRAFAAELADEAPALGPRPRTVIPVGSATRIVSVTLLAVLGAYPVMSLFGGPLWMVALAGAVVCAVATVDAGVRPTAIAREVSWEILPFLVAVVLVATGLTRAGVVGMLGDLYASTPAPSATVAATSALGSAILNNHPMALINLLAVNDAGGDTRLVLAGLVGGDLGPRLLPIGSLAGLLWLGVLRAHGVHVGVRRFVVLGVLVTVPSIAASIGVLYLVT